MVLSLIIFSDMEMPSTLGFNTVSQVDIAYAICKSGALSTSFHILSSILDIYVTSGFDLSIGENNFL